MSVTTKLRMTMTRVLVTCALCALAFPVSASEGYIPSFSDETLDRMFEPYFSTKPQGSGLGLPSALGVVRAHRGQIDVVTRPGGGSTFAVLVPVHAWKDAPCSSG